MPIRVELQIKFSLLCKHLLLSVALECQMVSYLLMQICMKVPITLAKEEETMRFYGYLSFAVCKVDVKVDVQQGQEKRY